MTKKAQSNDWAFFIEREIVIAHRNIIAQI